MRPLDRFNGLVALTGSLIALIVVNSSESSAGGLGVQFRTCSAPLGGDVLETAMVIVSAWLPLPLSSRATLPVLAMPPISDALSSSEALIT